MAKTIAEINEKIKEGSVVVVTAEEIIDLVKREGAEAAAERVDVVTTGTFGPHVLLGGLYQPGSQQTEDKDIQGLVERGARLFGHSRGRYLYRRHRTAGSRPLE